MAWDNVQPNMGRYGALWVAPQTAFGTPATVPTHALRVRSYMPPLQQFIRTTDEYADKSMEQKFERIQGSQIDNRSVTIELTPRDLALLLTSTLGESVVPGGATTGTITPKTGDFAVYAPGVPLTVWQLHPGGNIVASDVQIMGIQIDIPPRGNVTATLTLGVTKIGDLGSVPTAPTISQEVLQYRHFYAKYDGVTLKPEGGQINLTFPMSVVDAAQGLLADDRALNPLGWERSGPRVARIQFTTAGTPAALRTGYGVTDPANLKPAEAGFKLPSPSTKQIAVKLTTGQVKGHDPSNGLDRFTTQHAIEAVSLDGLPPFTVDIPA
ncbi:hypothetical protein K7W42_20275 [Deinococcus sp. HMF7604]|uniref:hypothetical protein n=1 Tax=Deinococcus betulae TaxID=2873312 RepID=UPI001CCCD902|nr:hypothetical protein [Deinococcus betulae]MBZ9753176.1 hypothetical protein [Deinococcus betulae]